VCDVKRGGGGQSGRMLDEDVMILGGIKDKKGMRGKIQVVYT